MYFSSKFILLREFYKNVNYNRSIKNTIIIHIRTKNKNLLKNLIFYAENNLFY